MGELTGGRTAPARSDPLEPARLSRIERRDALLDAAALLVAAGDVEAVSMDAVAEQAGVSRPLVYKHFGNRFELLSSLYRREAAHLHAEMSAEVTAAETLEDMVRALVRGALRAQADRAATFAALQAGGARDSDRRDEQRRRNRTTVRYFANQAVRELDLDEPRAKTAMGIMLGAVETVLAQWRRRPTREHARLLEDTYAALVMGGLEELARR
jgi:AcrR family transcriptional regulator